MLFYEVMAHVSCWLMTFSINWWFISLYSCWNENSRVETWIKLFRFVPGSQFSLLNFFPMGSKLFSGCIVSPGNQSMTLNTVPFIEIPQTLTNLEFVLNVYPCVAGWIPDSPRCSTTGIGALRLDSFNKSLQSGIIYCLFLKELLQSLQARFLPLHCFISN